MISKIFKFIIGGKPVYKSVPRNPNAIREAQKQGGELVQKPSQAIVTAAKPFKPISGAGSRTVPSAAQRAERAAQASRIPKPKPATSSGTGGSGRPPARVSGPPQRSGARKDIVVAKPRQVARPSSRVSGPPKRSGARVTPTPRKPNTNTAAMKALMAGIMTGQTAPTGTPPAKAAPAAKSVPVPKAKPAEMKSPAPRERTKVKKRTNFTSGDNTGFGPKGNIFPSSSEERKALMIMYGGTGSKAGKAAIAGTQGNLAKGQSLLDAAKNKRLSNVGVSGRANPNLKKGGKVTPSKYKGFSKLPEKVQKKMNPKAASKYKKGGKISIKEIKTKGSVSLEQMPSKKYSNPSARQVKGWGAARKPKR